MGGGGAGQRACMPGDDGAGRTAPVAFDGRFAPGAPVLLQGPTIPIVGSPGAIAMADLDADGRLDVVAAADARVSVLVNAGEGAFAPTAGPTSSSAATAAGASSCW